MVPPLISVIIDTYNHERLIEDCIDSALAQDYPAERTEILVVDDGSTDGTAERVKKYGDRVRYIHKENGDFASAIILAFQSAKGDLIALLDGDDVWLPNKLSRVAEEFAKDPRTVMVFHKYLFWDSRDNSIWQPYAFADVSGDVLADEHKLLRFFHAPTSSLTFRREAFQRTTNIPVDRGFPYDLFLFTAALFLGPIGCVPEVLSKNRIHGKNRWEAGKAGADEATLRRRVQRGTVAIEIIRDWIRENTPKCQRRQADTILRRYRLMQQNTEYELKPPGRFRSFGHEALTNLTFGRVMTRAHLTYRWTHAFAALIFGRHAHYLEGIRTRARSLRRRFWPALPESGPASQR